MRSPSGAYEANALLLAPDVILRKPDPSALMAAICAPPLTGSTGFFAPMAKSRNDANFPSPKMMVSPPGDHCGKMISSSLLSNSRFGGPSPAP
jgi:hypothetical protein